MKLSDSLLGFVRQRHPSGSAVNELERALRDRVSRPSARAMVRDARLVFAPSDGEAWTVEFGRGRVSLKRGRPRNPSSTLFAKSEIFVDVLDGRLAGVDAFLRGDLLVRGNLALPLEIDDLLPPPRRDPRSPNCQTVDAGGLQLFYLEAGPRDAPPVVLLHGLGATSASFLPTIWDLAADHHVYSLDLPGFGESTKPLRPLHAAFFAKSVVAFLDALGLDRVHLVGNSMGGRAALEVALRSPERVDRLVLLAPSLAWLRFRMATHLVKFLRPEMAFVPIPVLHRMVLSGLHGMFAQPERIPKAAMNGAADEFLRVFATPRGRIAFFHAAREIYLEDAHGRRGFWHRLPSLARPTLFVFGDRDVLVPHRFMRHVQRAVPAAHCVVLEDCGHVPQFEMPVKTHAMMREFFAGRAPRQP
jgi:pimeloyl-ACP methyl ester carboxylesterase